MNILIINHYAGSPNMGMEFRPYYFAKKWQEMGHNVTIIASNFSHLRINNPKVFRDFYLKNIEGINYCWVRTCKYQGNGVKRAVSMAQFVFKLLIFSKYLCNKFKPDVVIASSTYPMDTFVASKIKRLSNAKYVHEIHDMWPATLIEIGGMSKYHPFVVLNQIAEDYFCHKSDLVVSIPPSSKDYLVKHGLDDKKFRHIPNCIVSEEWKDSLPLPQEHENILNELRSQGKFIVAFTGSHNEAYGLEYLIDAIRELDRNDVCAVFVGSGYLKDELIKATEMERDKFIFLSSVPKKAIPTLLDNVDTIYVSGVKDELFKYGISMNKLTDAMMAGKPILYAVNAPNNYIEEYNCGVSVKPRSSEELSRGLNSLLLMSKEQRDELGNNGKIAVMKDFEISVLAKRFLDYIVGDKK